VAPYRFTLFIICSIIFATGILMIFSTTSAEVLDHDLSRSTHQAILKQILFAAFGIGGALVIQKLGYQKILQNSGALLAFFSLLLLMTLIPGIGKAVNGSRRWLTLGGFSFQPSEFVKYIIPMYYIYCTQTWKGPFNLHRFLKLIAILAIPVLLILVEPNNGTAAVIVMTLVVLFGLTKVPLKYFGIPLLAFALIGGVLAIRLPYVASRIKVYLNPELDLKGKGHQPYQAKIAAGSGQLWGKGPGNSLQKLSYLPEAQNDYIAAIFAEEFGFAGILALILLYMSLSYLGFAISYLAPREDGYYLGAAIAFLISFQAFLNMGVVSGLLPSTGLNLPLFSQGGTSLVANIMGISLLCSTQTVQCSASSRR
jgi:cell division protein FtsW